MRPSSAGSDTAGIPFPELGTTALPAPFWVPWVAERVDAARAVAARLPMPTPRDEAWRFTDIAPIVRQSYRVDTPAAAGPDGAMPAPLVIEEAADARLVFVDGVYAPQWSSTRTLPSGLRLQPLSALLADGGQDAAGAAAVRAHLARQAPVESDFFSALNTARLSDGAAVVCDPGVVVPGALHLLFLSTSHALPLAVHPRVLVVAGAGCDLTLVEEHAGLGSSIVFANAVAECVVEANASLRHVRLQRENASSFHVGRCAVSVARDGRYSSVSINTGARLSRLDLCVSLDGEGAQVSLDGLALIDARQHSDTHTLIDHAKPQGSSRQLHKCVCDGAAHAVFNGRILVRPDAQRTDSAQQSRGLLLSRRAQVNAKPQLEIFADDVKAAHGATVGQLDDDELFYLASRGLPVAQARKLLTYAFAAEVIDRIPVRSLVARLAAQLMARSGL